MSFRALDRLRALIRSEHLAPVLGPALRASLALGAPVVGLQLLGRPELGLLPALAAFNLALADEQSPYRLRALLSLSGTLFMVAATFVGTLVSARPWLAALLMGLVAAGAGFARALGQAATGLGLCTWVLFLCAALAIPGSPSSAPLHAALVAGGGVWATLLALALWPLRPYQPLYRRVGAAWEAAAQLLAAVAAGEEAPQPSDAREARLNTLTAQVRTAVEDAVDALGARRASTQGSNPIGEGLLVLTRGAARLEASAVALDGALEAIRTSPRCGAIAPAIAATTGALGNIARAVATAVSSGGAGPPTEALRSRIEDAAARVDGLAAGAATAPPLSTDPVAARGVAAALGEVVGHLRSAADALEQVRHPLSGHGNAPLASLDVLRSLRESGHTLRDHLTPDSIYFRHAVRLALATSAGIALYTALGLPRGYWIVLTLIIVLQPDFGGTLQRAGQRVLGTLAGALAASVLLALAPGTLVHDLLLAASTFGTVALLHRRYSLAVACITIMLVVLLESLMPVTWGLAAYRLLNTAIGGVLAVAAGYALLPRWERQRFPQQMATALRANREYLRAVAGALASAAGLLPGVMQARRVAEVESGNASASFQRMVAEPAAQRGNVGLAYALVTFSARVTRELTALAAHLPSLRTRLTLPGLMTFADQVGGALDALAAWLADGKPLGPIPPVTATLPRMEEMVRPAREGAGGSPSRPADAANPPEVLDAALVLAQLDKVAREVTGMHLAAEKAQALGAPSPSRARNSSTPGGSPVR